MPNGYGAFIGPAALGLADSYADNYKTQYVSQLGPNSNRKILDIAALYLGTMGIRRVPSGYRDAATYAAGAAAFDLTRLLVAPKLIAGSTTGAEVIDYAPVSDPGGAAGGDAGATADVGSEEGTYSWGTQG